MNKHELDTQTFPRGIGWIFGTIVGLIMFALSIFIIEEIGFIINNYHLMKLEKKNIFYLVAYY